MTNRLRGFLAIAGAALVALIVLVGAKIAILGKNDERLINSRWELQECLDALHGCQDTNWNNGAVFMDLVAEIHARDDGCNRFLTLPVGDCVQKADKRIVCPGWKVASAKELTHSLDWRRTMCEAPAFKLDGEWVEVEE